MKPIYKPGTAIGSADHITTILNVPLCFLTTPAAAAFTGKLLPIHDG